MTIPRRLMNSKMTCTVLHCKFQFFPLLAWTQVFENPDALLRKFDLEAVLQKLRDSMRQQYPLVRDVFRP